MEKKNNKIIYVILLIILFIILIGFGIFLIKEKKNKVNTSIENNYLSYRIKSNELSMFDLYFLQLDNSKKNKVYSPLSIKYALRMLEDGAKGETRNQISNIIGSYNATRYVNSKNMSFANAMFIRESFKDLIKDSYKEDLVSKYNADIIFDSFNTPDKINSWVNDKTLGMIDSLMSDVSDLDFALINALAIDMEWVNVIQSKEEDYEPYFEHRKFYNGVSSLVGSGFSRLEFDGTSYDSLSVMIGATANRYDIVNVLGEDNIRKTVGEEYQKALDDENFYWCDDEEKLDVEEYLDNYIKEINVGYKDVSSSTDFRFIDNEEIKGFSKDLKEYDGIQLEYIGIMPKDGNLEEYIKNMDDEKISDVIYSFKSMELNSFQDGVITKLYGNIPLFDFEYEMDLIGNLNKLGIINVFDNNKADLSNISSEKISISDAKHKANIKFSNEGIKAAAATLTGGKGAGDCGFDYIYEVPTVEIDLTFDKPFMFLIRDKETKEVWFSGTVYEPIKYDNSYNGY